MFLWLNLNPQRGVHILHQACRSTPHTPHLELHTDSTQTRLHICEVFNTHTHTDVFSEISQNVQKCWFTQFKTTFLKLVTQFIMRQHCWHVYVNSSFIPPQMCIVSSNFCVHFFIVWRLHLSCDCSACWEVHVIGWGASLFGRTTLYIHTALRRIQHPQLIHILKHTHTQLLWKSN